MDVVVVGGDGGSGSPGRGGGGGGGDHGWFVQRRLAVSDGRQATTRALIWRRRWIRQRASYSPGAKPKIGIKIVSQRRRTSSPPLLHFLPSTSTLTPIYF